MGSVAIFIKVFTNNKSDSDLLTNGKNEAITTTAPLLAGSTSEFGLWSTAAALRPFAVTKNGWWFLLIVPRPAKPDLRNGSDGISSFEFKIIERQVKLSISIDDVSQLIMSEGLSSLSSDSTAETNKDHDGSDEINDKNKVYSDSVYGDCMIRTFELTDCEVEWEHFGRDDATRKENRVLQICFNESELNLIELTMWNNRKIEKIPLPRLLHISLLQCLARGGLPNAPANVKRAILPPASCQDSQPNRQKEESGSEDSECSSASVSDTSRSSPYPTLISNKVVTPCSPILEEKKKRQSGGNRSNHHRVDSCKLVKHNKVKKHSRSRSRDYHPAHFVPVVQCIDEIHEDPICAPHLSMSHDVGMAYPLSSRHFRAQSSCACPALILDHISPHCIPQHSSRLCTVSDSNCCFADTSDCGCPIEITSLRAPSHPPMNSQRTQVPHSRVFSSVPSLIGSARDPREQSGSFSQRLNPRQQVQTGRLHTARDISNLSTGRTFKSVVTPRSSENTSRLSARAETRPIQNFRNLFQEVEGGHARQRKEVVPESSAFNGLRNREVDITRRTESTRSGGQAVNPYPPAKWLPRLGASSRPTSAVGVEDRRDPLGLLKYRSDDITDEMAKVKLVDKLEREREIQRARERELTGHSDEKNSSSLSQSYFSSSESVCDELTPSVRSLVENVCMRQKIVEEAKLLALV